MKTIFMCCYKSLKDADESLEILLKYFEDHPSPFVESIEIREAVIKPVYPYWLGVVCDTMYLHAVDDWICGVRYPCPDFYSGPSRCREFYKMAKNVKKFVNVDGTMEEV